MSGLLIDTGGTECCCPPPVLNLCCIGIECFEDMTDEECEQAGGVPVAGDMCTPGICNLDCPGLGQCGKCQPSFTVTGSYTGICSCFDGSCDPFEATWSASITVTPTANNCFWNGNDGVSSASLGCSFIDGAFQWKASLGHALGGNHVVCFDNPVANLFSCFPGIYGVKGPPGVCPPSGSYDTTASCPASGTCTNCSITVG